MRFSVRRQEGVRHDAHNVILVVVKPNLRMNQLQSNSRDIPFRSQCRGTHAVLWETMSTLAECPLAIRSQLH